MRPYALPGSEGDPAILFRQSNSGALEEGEGVRYDSWADHLSRRGGAGRYAHSARQTLRPTATFEPDYDEDPADAVRVRRCDPADLDVYPHVEIGPRYRKALPMAERYLEYKKQEPTMAAVDIVELLAVEFDYTDYQPVVDDLVWMGVIEEKMVHSSLRRHGRIKTYLQQGCRCGPCTGAFKSALQTPKKAGTRGRACFGPKTGGPIPHGTQNGYTNYGCRCSLCKDAAREYTRARTARLKAAMETAAAGD